MGKTSRLKSISFALTREVRSKIPMIAMMEKKRISGEGGKGGEVKSSRVSGS
jgi:hypothetical protein